MKKIYHGTWAVSSAINSRPTTVDCVTALKFCIQGGRRDAARRAGPFAVAKTCFVLVKRVNELVFLSHGATLWLTVGKLQLTDSLTQKALKVAKNMQLVQAF